MSDISQSSSSSVFHGPLARPAPRRLAGDVCDAAHVDADRRQGAAGARAAGEPLVERAAVRTARGLTTGAMPYGGRDLQIDFDFVEHSLRRPTSDGAARDAAAGAASVADFYRECMAALERARRRRARSGRCRSRCRADPFAAGPQHASYDPEAVAGVLAGARRDRLGVQGVPRAVHRQVQPGALLLGQLRPGGHAILAAAGPRRARTPTGSRGEAYSHEVHQPRLLARRHRPAPKSQPALLLLHRPRAQGHARATHPPAGRCSIRSWGVRPAVRGRAGVRNPRQMLLEFLQSTYEAGANAAGWERGELERG